MVEVCDYTLQSFKNACLVTVLRLTSLIIEIINLIWLLRIYSFIIFKLTNKNLHSLLTNQTRPCQGEHFEIISKRLHNSNDRNNLTVGPSDAEGKMRKRNTLRNFENFESSLYCELITRDSLSWKVSGSRILGRSIKYFDSFFDLIVPMGLQSN